MEKTNFFVILNYQNLLWRIVGGVRRAARAIPVFRDSHNGCIRITVVPLSREADAWLGGGTCDFGAPEASADIVDICEREFVYKIDPRGSHTIQYVCDDGHTEPVNCYGYSALKIAFASWKRKFAATTRKGELLDDVLTNVHYRQETQFFTEDNGWSVHEGAVYTTVMLNGEDFIRLYVCVSGAKASEDKQCALAGMLEAQEYLEKCAEVECSPYIDGTKSPLKQVVRD